MLPRRTPVSGHGDAPVPPDRPRRRRLRAHRLRARGGAEGRRSASLQQVGRAIHGTRRPGQARALDARRRSPRLVHRDRGGARNAVRWSPPGHQSPWSGRDTAPFRRDGRTHAPRRRRPHNRPRRGLTHGPFSHGRRRHRRGLHDRDRRATRRR